MSNDTVADGRPARASLENNGGFDASVVHVPLKAPITGSVEVVGNPAFESGTAGEKRSFELFLPWILSPQINNGFVKLVVQPTAAARATQQARKRDTAMAGGSGGEPITGTFTVTLRFGPPSSPTVETCTMPAVLYED